MTSSARVPLAGTAAPTGPRSAPRTARERARADIMAELMSSARVRVATDGAANLSLRAVARDLGVASSAVYRYVDSRDALLTLLIVDAYDTVGRVAEEAAARAHAAQASDAQTWLDVARAVRAWALENRHAYALIYGTPVPGYLAPQDTVAPAVRLWGVMIQIVQSAYAHGTLRPTGPEFDPAGRMTAEAYAVGGVLDPGAAPDELAQLVSRLPTLFSSLIGAISVELFGHLHRVGDDLAALFDVTIATAAAGVGLHVDLTSGA